jgi:hypothetical protein
MDPAFRRGFSEALAKELIENEDKEEQKRSEGDRYEGANDELARTTFEQLHFDQPIGVSAQGCRILGQALINPKQPQYSLSNRLLNGLRQSLDRHHRDPKVGSQPTAQDMTRSDASGEGNESLVRPPTQDSSEDLAAALAHLFWTICGRIPLRILCYDDPPEALLGSYRGGVLPVTSQQPLNPINNAEPSDLLQEIPEQPLLANGGPLQEYPHRVGDDDRDNDSTHSRASTHGQEHHLNGSTPQSVDSYDGEVWAEESDPSDYDYGGESVGPPQDIGSLDDLDPAPWMFPSRQPEPLSHLEVAQALASLLSDLSFHDIAALSWTSRVDEELKQLALVLLLARNHHHGSSVLGCMEESVLQQLALRAVHVLRDAAACHPDRLPAYLQLLQTMIQVHDLPRRGAAPGAASQLGPSRCSQNESPSLPPATWLALSLFSSLCSNTFTDACNQPQPRHKIQRQVDMVHNCLVESMDHLVDILESIDTGSIESDSPIHIFDNEVKDEIFPALLAPFFYCLALPVSSQTKQIQSYQLLLNSGFFRQWLLLWQCQHQKHLRSAETDHQKALKANLDCMESSLLELCAASPKLMGKYAWRFSGFATAVTKLHTRSYPLEWNLLGMEISEDSSPTKIQWKSSSAPLVEPPPSSTECRASSRTLFQRRLEAVQNVVTNWKEERHSGKSASHGDAIERLHRDQRILVEFEAMVNRLSRCSLLREALLRLDGSGGSDGGDRWSVHEWLIPLQQLLAVWPKQQQQQQRATSAENRLKAKLDDSREPLDPVPAGAMEATETRLTTATSFESPSWKQGAQDAAVDALRRSLKTLQSFVDESRPNLATAASHSIAPFSSKVD